MWTLLQAVGGVLTILGVALLSPPAAIITAGLMIFVVGYLGEG